LSLRQRLEELTLPSFAPKPKGREVAVLLQQMAIMMKNGLDVATILDSLSDQQDNAYLSKALESIRNEVIYRGVPLSHALKGFPELFPPAVILLARAGEQSGDLTGCLEQGGKFLEKADELRRQIKSGLASPAMTACAGAIMLFLVVKLVFPKFIDLYAQMDLELPAITKAVLGLVAFLNHPAFLLTLAVGSGLLYYYRERLRQSVFRLAVQIPGIDKMVGTILCAEMCSVVAVLYKAGVPLNRTMHLLAQSADYDYHRDRLEEVCKRLRYNGCFSESMEAITYFPHFAQPMILVGEESGALEEMMSSVHRILEQKIELIIGQVVNLLEPLFIALLGFVMTFFFVGMFLPIYDMLTQLGP
jgi:type II secretory pathway component PulF